MGAKLGGCGSKREATAKPIKLITNIVSLFKFFIGLILCVKLTNFI